MQTRVLLALIVLSATARLMPAGEQRLDVELGRSRIDVAVKATAGSFTGKLGRYEPLITFDEEGRVATARLTFHFRDVSTGSEKRDRHMHTWQRTEVFPGGEFVLGALRPGPDGGQIASGQLTFHGVTREISFPVRITKDNSLCAVDGDATIDTRDYGLPVIRMMALLKVDPVVQLRFHLEGKLSPVPASLPNRS